MARTLISSTAPPAWRSAQPGAWLLAAWLLATCLLMTAPAAGAQSLTDAGNDPTTGMSLRTDDATGDGLATDAAAAPDPNASQIAMPIGGAKPVAKPATTTAAISDQGNDPLSDALVVDEDRSRLNLRETTVDGLRSRLEDRYNDAPGIRLGSFVLKPSLSQGLERETTRTGASRETRTYSETGLKGTLTSDWARHQLKVTGSGVFQRNISGSGETEPEADLDAELRLDIGKDVTGTLTAGYHFEREDSTDPNAITTATVQSGIHQYSLGAGIERDFGLLRGSTRLNLNRMVYGSAELSDGSTLSLGDRDRNTGTLTTRVGYELSPALVPFLEVSAGRSLYDLRRDSGGYARSYADYGARGGLEVDLGEKLKGELALGYSTYRFDDSRLEDVDGVTLDGIINWSPRRGTDVATSLSTAIEPSTTNGESGALLYTLSNVITHQMRDALVARLSNSLTFRNYPAGSASQDQTVWFTGAGLTWDLNRYLALTGDISYERTTQRTGSDTSVAKIGVGLTLRR